MQAEPGNPVDSYHLHKGTTTGGDVTSVWDEGDGKTLDIRLRRRGFYPNYFYELIVDFVVDAGYYDYIGGAFSLNFATSGTPLIKITVFYRDGTNTVIASVSEGSFEKSINGVKQLDYIRLSYNKWQKAKVTKMIYIDWISAYD
ncbi:MAG: hypothetical protein ACW99E_23065 [Promethearchaeota archaeon]